MNNIRKALRYIYIYRLNLAKAGWAHDRQPREVWERRKAKASNNTRAEEPNILHEWWRDEEDDRSRRLFDGRWKHILCKYELQRDTQHSQCDKVIIQFLSEHVEGERRLTSKEVAA